MKSWCRILLDGTARLGLRQDGLISQNRGSCGLSDAEAFITQNGTQRETNGKHRHISQFATFYRLIPCYQPWLCNWQDQRRRSFAWLRSCSLRRLGGRRHRSQSDTARAHYFRRSGDVCLWTWNPIRQRIFQGHCEPVRRQGQHPGRLRGAYGDRSRSEWLLVRLWLD
jgi:hypothetical protein